MRDVSGLACEADARLENRELNTIMKRAKRQQRYSSDFRLRPVSRGLLRYLSRLGSRKALSRAGWGALATVPGLALAGPSGESVVAGSVNVARPDANTTQINQASQSAIVNWNTFSINGNEYVLIQQPNSSATILNRVIGSQQSQILGQLQANGRVFLVNPQGVYIGPNASIDVGAITLSALDINNEDFLNGNYVFSGQAGNGSVVNDGAITTSDGGFVVLAGDYVNNTGVITATLGTVVLAAGEQMTLDIDNDGLVGFAVDEATVAELAGVENAGDIIADGGRVVMTASVANDLVATAVNNQGLVRAQRIEEQGGEIYLTGYGGDVNHAGTLDVAGQSGASGGEALVYSTKDVTLEAQSKIIATGDEQQSGGNVRVIANGNLAFREDAFIGADGGFVELSGHQGLSLGGEVQVRQGTLLIDPAVLAIRNDASSPTGACGAGVDGCVGKGEIENQLNSGTNVILVADQEIKSSGGPFTITATTPSYGSSVGDLEIKIGTGGTGVDCLAFGVCTGNGGFTNDPTGDINLGDVNIDILGDFTASAGTSIGTVNLGSVRAANVNITAGSAGGDINVGPAVAIGSFSGSFSSSLFAPGGGTIGIAAASTDLFLTAQGGNVNVNGNISLVDDASTNIDIKANITSGTINVNGNISAITSLGSESSFDAEIMLEAANTNVSGNILASGVLGARTRLAGTSNVNINVSGNVGASASGQTQVLVSGTGNVSVGGVTAQGSTGSAVVNGNNVNLGAVNVSGGSAAYLSVDAANNLNINGAVNLFEAGGGSATARFGGLGLTQVNAPINVVAGPGGMANVSFAGTEGTPIDNLVVNRAVSVNGGAGGYLRVDVRNSAVTNGAGILKADQVQISTYGPAPSIDLDVFSPSMWVQTIGGAPNITLNNSTFNGPSSLAFGTSTSFRSATFLANSNLSFMSPFMADRLLVGVPNGVVNFDAPVFITGANPFAPTPQDLSLFNIMATRGLAPPSHGPNVQILGGLGVNMTNPFVLGGNDPFIKLFSSRGFNTGGLTTSTNASSILGVFNPINLAAPIFFGDTPQIPPPGALGFFNSVNVQGLPDNGGTTVVIGESLGALPLLSGDVNIGPDTIDLGNRNMFIISRGNVSGDDLVTTNGIFEIIGLAATNIFQIPVINEFDDVDDGSDEEEDDDEVVDPDGDGGGDDDGTISEESNSESMECSA